MARQSKKLKPLGLAKLAPGRHGDGDNLYLVVDDKGPRRWLFIYRWKESGQPGTGKLREMGLGSFSKVDLAMARTKAADARKLLGKGVDPIADARASMEVPLFGEFADKWAESQSRGLRSDKSKARIKRALTTYAKPLRELKVDAINTAHVLKALEAPPESDPKGKPLWLRVPVSARMARAYIEAVLDAAKARGWRTGENPARWKGHLDKLLTKAKPAPRHHEAMAYEDTPAFVKELRARGATAALAMEFLILGANRTGEVLGARWEEIDRAAKVWTLPAGRMKAGKEHRVPLTPRMIEILDAMEIRKVGALVFPGPRTDVEAPLSNMAFEMLLRRMKRTCTTHGFRSAFRDWAAERTNFAREIAEAALAHRIGDATERAYRRGDALEKRRKLMEAWAGYLATLRAKADDGSNVSPIRRPAA